MNPIEKIAVTLLKKEMAAHPELLAQFLDRYMEQSPVGKALEPAVNEAIVQLVPFLLAEIPS